MISIIGAGPAGSYLASLLAKDHEVEIFEDHKEVGIPFQCTGITTAPLEDFVKLPKEILLTKIKRVEVYSPDKTKLEFKLKKPNIVVDRIGFDKFLAEKAEDSGVKINLNHRFIKNVNNIMELKSDGKTITKKFDHLVGADGPFSAVAKSNIMYGNRKFMTGYQARINLEMDPETIEVWLGIGLFGWLVPENNKVVRIGLVCNSNEKPVELFNKLLKLRSDNPRIIDYQPGLIPIYDPKLQTQKDNIYLIGDAATQVKASTLGGIIPGLRAGHAVKESIETKQSYKVLCQELNKDLRINLKIYNIMNKFSESEFNTLLNDLTKPKTKELIETIDRDYVSKMAFKLFFTNPKLLKYGLKLL